MGLQGRGQFPFPCSSLYEPSSTAGHRPGPLQHPFHPAVTELDPMLGRESGARSDQNTSPDAVQNPLHHRHRYPLRGRLAPKLVKQSAKAKFLIALPPTPHLPIADADDLRRLPPGDLLRHPPKSLPVLSWPAPWRPSTFPCLAWPPTLAARKADISLANSTGHIMC